MIFFKKLQVFGEKLESSKLTSTVGLPLESRISRARTPVMDDMSDVEEVFEVLEGAKAEPIRQRRLGLADIHLGIIVDNLNKDASW